MTSYQKLKEKCECLRKHADLWKSKCARLQGQLNVFRNALTIAYKEPEIKIRDDGITSMEYFYQIHRNKIDEDTRLELQKWVAENLDEETILKLLEMKKENK